VLDRSIALEVSRLDGGDPYATDRLLATVWAVEKYTPFWVWP
jgi:siroheme synthase